MTYVFFKRPEHMKPFVAYMNSKHRNINFSFEKEKAKQMLFFDANVFPGNLSSWLTFIEKKHLLGFTRNFLTS